MEQAWILRYGELGLKSKVVRRQFQRALKVNMERLAFNSGISIFKDRLKTMDVMRSDSSAEETENLLEETIRKYIRKILIEEFIHSN